MDLFDQVDVPEVLDGLFDPQAATFVMVVTAVLVIAVLAVMLVRQVR